MKNNIKNKNGRPREHDRDKIAQEMIEWARLPASSNLNAFCVSLEPPIDPSKISNWAKEDDNFRQAYRITKSYLAKNREEMLSDGILHQAAYNRNARVYDFFENEKWEDETLFAHRLKEEMLKLEIKLKSIEQVQATQEDIERYEMMMRQLKAIHSYPSALKAASISSKTE